MVKRPFDGINVDALQAWLDNFERAHPTTSVKPALPTKAQTFAELDRLATPTTLATVSIRTRKGYRPLKGYSYPFDSTPNDSVVHTLVHCWFIDYVGPDKPARYGNVEISADETATLLAWVAEWRIARRRPIKRVANCYR
jgi:hypothetical protein